MVYTFMEFQLIYTLDTVLNCGERLVCNVWPHVVKGIKWAIGNKKSFSLWNDNWVPEVCNIGSHVQQIPLGMGNMCAAGMVNPDGSLR